MTTPITHYSMQDFTSPYADIERLPRLTAKEEPALLHDLRFARQAPAAKQRLIEGYLTRVLTLARHYDHQYRVVALDDRQRGHLVQPVLRVLPGLHHLLSPRWEMLHSW